MSATSLLVSDRPAFESTWRAALEQVGLVVETASPSDLPARLSGQVVVVLDGASSYFDEDELLAHAGLVRALGKPVAVGVPADGALASVEDLLTDICLGLLSRGETDVGPIAQVLARRADPQRSNRFEYITVSPRPSELLAIMGDGRTSLLRRPLSEEDDGSEIAAIDIGEDADEAVLELSTGKRITVRAIQGFQGQGSTAEGAVEQSSIDGASLGARLRELRLAAGLTQAELARRTGIHRPNIARVEAGRHTPSLETLARLAGAIGVPTSRVLSGG